MKLGTAARFWPKVRKGAPDQCWLWQGSKNQHGYGRFGVDGRNCHAHRVSWEMAKGPIRNGLQVLHRCDTPACVNPAHLWLGTHEDNMADRQAKRRFACYPGEKHPNAKLTEAVVREIKKRRARGDLLRDIAHDHSVAIATVSGIARGVSWSHVSV